MFRPNDTIGSYTLVRKLGRGAFGEVWLAEERTLVGTHKVALKLPNEDDIDLDEIRREAALWEEIKGHPNILPIIKADIVDGQIYIASEYASDGSLLQWLKDHGGRAPSLEAAVSMTAGILSGLAHLHSKRVIHRDLKPANILLQSETPRIADFGISRILKTTVASANTAGTPAYMAPECFEGRRSERSDLWSTGVIFYQLLTGKLPFPQADAISLMNAILSREPQLDMQALPGDLALFIGRVLEKDPDRRFQSAVEMSAALRATKLTGFRPSSEAKTEVLPGPSTDPEVLPTVSAKDAVTLVAPHPETKPANSGPRIFESASIAEIAPNRTPLILGIGIASLMLLVLLVVGIYFVANWASSTSNSNGSAAVASELAGLLPSGVTIDLPRDVVSAKFEPDLKRSTSVVVVVPREGEIYVNKTRVAQADLGREVQRAFAVGSKQFMQAAPQRDAFLLASAQLTNGSFEQIRDTLQRAGVSELSLVVSRKGGQDEPIGVLRLHLQSIASGYQGAPALKPNPLSLRVKISAARGISLNTEWMGTVDDTSTLKSRLSAIFTDRQNNAVFREGTNQVETTVILTAEAALTFSDLVKVIDAIVGAGSDQVVSGTPVDTLAEPTLYPTASPAVGDPLIVPPNASMTPTGGEGGGTGTGTGSGDPAKIYQPNEVDQKARITSKPGPSYTESARKNQVEGVVRLQVVLVASGAVGSIRPVTNLPDGLTEQAIAAARRIQFAPAQKDGRPVSTYVTIEYNFRLY